MKPLYLITMLLFSSYTFAQEFKGYVFDEESAVENIEVSNLSRKITTYTNEVGRFTITAIEGDSIRFQSLFHESKIIVLDVNRFNGTQVIEIKKRVTQLTEVNIFKESDSLQFKEKQESAVIKRQIEADMVRYPLLYEKQKPVYAVDLVVIAGYISKLFKKKPAGVKTIRYNDFTKLFENSTFFTTALLTDEYGIPEKSIPLFFEYCEVQYFNSNLLEKENEILLLDELSKTSKSFLKLLEDNKIED